MRHRVKSCLQLTPDIIPHEKYKWSNFFFHLLNPNGRGEHISQAKNSAFVRADQAHGHISVVELDFDCMAKKVSQKHSSVLVSCSLLSQRSISPHKHFFHGYCYLILPSAELCKVFFCKDVNILIEQDIK